MDTGTGKFNIGCEDVYQEDLIIQEEMWRHPSKESVEASAIELKPGITLSIIEMII